MSYELEKAELPDIARRALGGICDRSGAILYSSHTTLKPGDVYLLGFNPGGEGGSPLRECINGMLHSDVNAYLDESWENRNGVWAPGEAPLQKRVSWLLERVIGNPREVCATNLIFVRSRLAANISYELVQQCWPVHEAILRIVQPKLIVAFGNSAKSPYSYLRSIFGGSGKEFPSGHGNWALKGFESTLNGRDIYVAGLPHLSRYSPIGKNHLVKWLREKI